MAILFTSLCGGICVTCILLSRNGINFDTIKNHKCSIFTLSLIFGLFELTMEACGLNRFLHESSIENGNGEYAELDGTSNLSDLGKKLFVVYQMNADPFVTSLLYTLIGIAFLIALSMSITIVIYIINNPAKHFAVEYYKIMWTQPKSSTNIEKIITQNFTSEPFDNNDDNEKYEQIIKNINKLSNNNKTAFILEIILFSMIIPALPFIIRSYIIDGKPPSFLECVCALGFAFCGGALHCVLQYTGCIVD
jgi:hypothetical protein